LHYYPSIYPFIDSQLKLKVQNFNDGKKCQVMAKNGKKWQKWQEQTRTEILAKTDKSSQTDKTLQ
jgi:hypothetical protein